VGCRSRSRRTIWAARASPAPAAEDSWFERLLPLEPFPLRA
jgi:hypothetical protein